MPPPQTTMFNRPYVPLSLGSLRPEVRLGPGPRPGSDMGVRLVPRGTTVTAMASLAGRRIVVVGAVVQERVPSCAPSPADVAMPIPF